MRRMRRGVVVLGLVLAAGAAGGLGHGVAQAQPGLSSAPNLDGAYNANRIQEEAMRAMQGLRKEGIEAMQKQDFAGAEKAFGKLVLRNPTTSDANYLLGLAKLALSNWAEARQYLEIAIRQEPSRPDPKARLGIAYVKLNDRASAQKQREELAKLAAKCNGCPDAKAIGDNMALLDRALGSAQPAPGN